MPVQLPASQHSITADSLNPKATDIVKELIRSGYEAYLVGGCVRDLLIGNRPKDFDIATNATPEQVCKLLKRSRIVGQRFKIVHVRAGRDIFEVTTFRRGLGEHASLSDTLKANRSKSSHSDKVLRSNDQGMLTRDNNYGSVVDDALRRDFSINAFYYDVQTSAVLDYTGGLEDLKNKTLRIIGEPNQRFREDPVRMLRALRFKAKLDFEIEAETDAAIEKNGGLLTQVSSARLFDEMLKLLMSGYGQRTWQLLLEYQFHHHLLSAIAEDIDSNLHQSAEVIYQSLKNTDQRIRQDKPVTPAFLYAALLWPAVEASVDVLQSNHPRWKALQLAAFEVIDSVSMSITIPKRFALMTRDIWQLQSNLETAKGGKAIKLLSHPRFRAAYDFLLMRESAGNIEKGRGQFWTELQASNPDQKYIPQSRRSKPSRAKPRQRYGRTNRS